MMEYNTNDEDNNGIEVDDEYEAWRSYLITTIDYSYFLKLHFT